MATAEPGADPDDLVGRIRAAAVSYRDFATADPARFSLLFGLPNPGFGRHSQHTSGRPAGATMAALEQTLRVVIDHGRLAHPLFRRVGPRWATEAGTAQAADGARIPADAYQALLHFPAAVHGFACLEAFDHLNWISDQARDELFDAQIELLELAMGTGPRAALI